MNDPATRGRRWLVGVLTLGGSLGLALLVNSCATSDQLLASPPAIPGATYVGNKACADCHARITTIFPASPHARLHLDERTLVAATKSAADDAKPAAPPRNARLDQGSGCESCHGPGSRHVATGGLGRDKFIVNPGRKPDQCFECHQATQAEFHLPQHHPVLEGKMNCVQCHDPHGSDILKPTGGLAMARPDESCAQCHREQTRPVVFEHAAMREGCAACHTPHGSINSKMLTSRDSNLCLRCHAQVQGPAAAGGIFIGNVNHTGYLRYGTCWTAGCHTAVHGSNTQPFYLY